MHFSPALHAVPFSGVQRFRQWPDGLPGTQTESAAQLELGSPGSQRAAQLNVTRSSRALVSTMQSVPWAQPPLLPRQFVPDLWTQRAVASSAG